MELYNYKAIIKRVASEHLEKRKKEIEQVFNKFMKSYGAHGYNGFRPRGRRLEHWTGGTNKTRSQLRNELVRILRPYEDMVSPEDINVQFWGSAKKPVRGPAYTVSIYLKD